MSFDVNAHRARVISPENSQARHSPTDWKSGQVGQAARLDGFGGPSLAGWTAKRQKAQQWKAILGMANRGP